MIVGALVDGRAMVRSVASNTTMVRSTAMLRMVSLIRQAAAIIVTSVVMTGDSGYDDEIVAMLMVRLARMI